MRPRRQLEVLLIWIALSGSSSAQATQTQTQPPAGAPAANPWAYSLTVDGYIVPDGDSYASPIFTADHNWLHLEARYNYEDQRTASLWLGYNYTKGKKLQLQLTPMIGGVFGQTNGIAPGLEATLTFKKLSFYSASEYVFDTTKTTGSFFYSWPQLTFQPVKWFRVGGVAQHTKAYHTSLNTQRGFLVGINIKQLEFTTYVFDPELPSPTTVLEVGYNF
jgi:hypothetical protein